MSAKPRAELVMLLVAVVVCLLVAEWVFATFRPQMTMSVLLRNSPRIFRESDFLPYELIPDADSRHATAEFDCPVRINSQGYRGPDFDPERPLGSRILVVGDSFTFGHGCAGDECYASVLRRFLGARLGESVIEVINAGYACGYYPDTYYVYLRRLGLDLSPDLVVVGFFIGNDVDRQDLAFNEWVEVDGRGLPLRVASTEAHVEGGYWVTNQRQLRYRLPVLRNSHLFQALVSVVKRTATTEGDGGPYYNEVMYVPEYTDRTRKAVERVKMLFREMDTMARDRGARLVVLMIPTVEQVETARFFGAEDRDGSLDLDKPQRLFGEFFRSEGIEFVDLLPAMRESARVRPLYFPNDQHWTLEGNEVAGRLLGQALIERGLVPRLEG